MPSQGPAATAAIAPGFLVASPKLDGSPFERALIMMVHHDDQGAMGFIVNKPLSIDLGSLLQTADEELEGTIDEACFGMHVRFGGPVRVEQLWLIYNDADDETEARARRGDLEERGRLTFERHWSLIADSSSIEAFVYGERDAPYRPFIGYTGWGPGQLEGEIEEGSWLLMEFEDALVFDDERDQNEAWSNALARLGVDPMAFLMMSKAGET